jgi:hypothetical protein
MVSGVRFHVHLASAGHTLAGLMAAGLSYQRQAHMSDQRSLLGAAPNGG